MTHFLRTVAIASFTLLAACKPAADSATQRVIEATATESGAGPSFVGEWVEERVSCGGGFDSFVLSADGAANGWEMVGTWRLTGDRQAEVHFTSSGMEEDEKRIDDRLTAQLSNDGGGMMLEKMMLVRCPPDPNIDLSGTARETPNTSPAMTEPAKTVGRSVAFRDLNPDQSREVIAALQECAVDVTADMTMKALDINRDSRTDWLVGVGRTTLSPCAGNANYSKLLVSREDGSFEGILLSYAEIIDNQTIKAAAFIDGCDAPSQRRLQWSQGSLKPTSACFSASLD